MPLQGDYAPLDAQPWVAEQIQKWESSGGSEGIELVGTDMPCVVVVNRGAKSGLLHRTPVMRVEHEGRYAVVGSKGGAPKHPTWVYNLRAHPEVELWDGPDKLEMVARELTGDERTNWWDRAAAAFPPYLDYQTKTDRLIPVFLLEPAA